MYSGHFAPRLENNLLDERSIVRSLTRATLANARSLLKVVCGDVTGAWMAGGGLCHEALHDGVRGDGLCVGVECHGERERDVQSVRLTVGIRFRGRHDDCPTAHGAGAR